MCQDNKRIEYIPYQDLSETGVNEEYNNILTLWNEFIRQNDSSLIENKDYFIHWKNLFEVIRRVDKRKVYYEVFHKLKTINECKYVAILAYWINTLKPFMVVNEDSKIYNAPNELFSVFLILSTIKALHNEIKQTSFCYPSSDRIADIVYNFKFCDLSREATIAFVETLADNYGVGIQHILNQKVLKDIKKSD